MTESEFQEIFTELHAAIAALIAAEAPDARISTREAYDADEETWIGRLKNSAGEVHCYVIAFTGVSEITEGAVADKILEVGFRIVAYRKYDFGTDASNSTRNFTDEINAIRFAFLNDRDLGQTWVEDHSDFKEQQFLNEISTIPVHVARADMKFYLANIPYTFS